MKKKRFPVPSDVAGDVLFASDRTCCVCGIPGRPTQIHHIDENPSNNVKSNLCVLCLLCHDETQIKGGFGRKLDARLIAKYRDDWNERVIKRRNKADELAAFQILSSTEYLTSSDLEATISIVPTTDKLLEYVNSLPAILSDGYGMARPRWDSGITSEMVQGTYDLIDIINSILVQLASWFPEGHFGQAFPKEYFSIYISARFFWHRALAEPNGVGTGGTIVGPIVASSVLTDLENSVDEVVTALLWERKDFNLDLWRDEWEKAKSN